MGRSDVVEELQHLQTLTPNTSPETMTMFSSSHQCVMDSTIEDDIYLPKSYPCYGTIKSGMRLHRYDTTPYTEANVIPGLNLPFLEEDWDEDATICEMACATISGNARSSEKRGAQETERKEYEAL
jgi:hypothetical protein